MKTFSEKLIAIEERLKNWWEFGKQEYPCIVARALKDDHGPSGVIPILLLTGR